MKTTANLESLQQYLSSVLTGMITYKNTAVTPRLLWCKQYAFMDKTKTNHCYPQQESLDDIEGTVIQRKVDDLHSWMIDLVVRQFYDLFRVKSTPVPDIKDSSKKIVANQVLNTIKDLIQSRSQQVIPRIIAEYASMGMNINPEQAMMVAEHRKMIVYPTESEIADIVESMRGVTRQYEKQEAAKSANNMMTYIKDLLAHSDSMGELTKFLLDFCVYPFAVMCADDFRYVDVREWDGERLVNKRKLIPHWRSVSAFDWFYTPDSTTPHDGLGVAERMALRLYEFMELKKRKYGVTMTKSVDAIMSLYDKKNLDWVSPQDNKERDTSWNQRPSDTIDVFRLIFNMPTSVLIELIKEGDNPDYDCTLTIPDTESCTLDVYLCAGYIVEIKVHDPSFRRPYEKESFTFSPDSFDGDALPEKLRVTNAASRKTFIHMIRNLGRSTSPTTFVNMDMLSDEELGEDEAILPDNQYKIFPKIGAYQRNPVDILSYPNFTNVLMAFSEFLDARADKESGIPRYALGNADGLNSALRSAQALETMINNALKTVTSRIFRIGRNVIAPCCNRMIDWVMNTSDDHTLMYDSEFVVEGIEGVIIKGIVLQQLRELLHYLAPYAAQGMIPPEKIQQLLNQYIAEAGMNVESSEDSIQGILTKLNFKPIPQSQAQQPAQPSEGSPNAQPV